MGKFAYISPNFTTNPIGMKKSSTSNSAKKMAGYSVMASAFLATATNAQGAVVYHDEVPDFDGAPGDLYDIDLDDDGSTDISLFAFTYMISGYTSGGAHGTSFLNDVFAIPAGGNYVAGVVGAYGYGYPYALDSGAGIADQDFLSFSADPRGYGYLSMAYSRYNVISGVSAQLFYSGYWLGGQTDKFLGVKFDIDGDFHYGWVRVDVGDDNHSFTVKDWAYDDVADADIEAGQTTGGGAAVHNVISENELTAYSFGNTINVIVKDFHAGNATVEVLNLEGKVVYSNSLNMNGMQIELSNAASGNYILYVVADGNASYSKQLFINN